MATNLERAVGIPSEVMFDILSRLPVKSLLRFKSVCKEWYKYINDSYFIKHHLKNSLKFDQRPFAVVNEYSLYLVDDLDFPSQRIELNMPNEVVCDGDKRLQAVIVGSCNGLLCLSIGWFFLRPVSNEELNCFMLCNPSTRSFKRVSRPTKMEELDNSVISRSMGPLKSGFGYDCCNDDYKIVLTTISPKDGALSFTYSLKADSWRAPQPVLKKIYDSSYNDGVFHNNALHYIVIVNVKELHLKEQLHHDTKQGLRIACFNLSSEEWEGEFCFPKFDSPIDMIKDRLHLGIFDGCIRLTRSAIGCTDIWIMKEYGVEGSWTKLLHLPRSRIGSSFWLDPIAYCKKKPEVLLLNSYKRFDPCLIWFDPKHNTGEGFEVDLPNFNYSVELYVGSLVSIPSSSQMIGRSEKVKYRVRTRLAV